MSKIKDELQRIQEKEFESYVSFMEWVCDQKLEVSDDVNESVEDSIESSTERTLHCTSKDFKRVNNINYNPKLGA